MVDELEPATRLCSQLKRIQAGSSHSVIKGTSLEIVLRRTLREYLPGYYRIGSGQIANEVHDLSPQLDVLVYDQTVFPHLAVNEDGSVVICCESLFGAVECKTNWDGKDISEHYRRFAEVEARRSERYSDRADAAAYYAVVFESGELSASALSALRDGDRFVGVYSVSRSESWTSPHGQEEFTNCAGNAIALLLKDLLLDCMAKGQKDVGDHTKAHDAVRRYIGGGP